MDHPLVYSLEELYLVEMKSPVGVGVCQDTIVRDGLHHEGAWD